MPHLALKEQWIKGAGRLSSFSLTLFREVAFLQCQRLIPSQNYNSKQLGVVSHKWDVFSNPAH